MAFTRQNPAFLCCYGFTVSSPRSQTLSLFLPSSKSSSPSFRLSQNNLHWIDLITICPLRPKSAGSGPPRAARSFWLSRHAPTRRHARPEVSGGPATHPTRLTRLTRPRASRVSLAHAPHAPHASHSPTRLTRLTRLTPRQP